MTAEIINQRHFWKDIGSSNFYFHFLKKFQWLVRIFSRKLNDFTIRDPWTKRNGSRLRKNLEPDQDRKTGGPWIPIYDKAIFKATDLGSISSLNTLTTWFDETNHYFGLADDMTLFKQNCPMDNTQIDLNNIEGSL